ncbi:MAG: ROK family protein [Prolixibacteraceae bacterium]|nr:ROK family protein [Prolixibacteraceae bacterium]
MSINSDIVLTLDAGGTNFVFSAMQNGESIIEPLSVPAHSKHLEKCIEAINEGFQKLISLLNEKPLAISFAFPGPADYEAGIIGDLTNLPAFRGGVPLGPILEEHFKLPVFINNDGDLYAYGEAIAGFLPQLNSELENKEVHKRYNNLIGITLGTGAGCGLVTNGVLHRGDNSAPAEIWLTGNRYTPNEYAEKGVGTKALIETYRHLSKSDDKNIMPYDIYKIAKGKEPGDMEAAKNTFELFGRNLGEVLANLITIYDGVVVIGGGITGAREFYMPALMNELNGVWPLKNGEKQDRLVHNVYDFDNENQRARFFNSPVKMLDVPGSNREIAYAQEKVTVVAHSTIGASEAISKGAYYFAMQQLKK